MPDKRRSIPVFRPNIAGRMMLVAGQSAWMVVVSIVVLALACGLVAVKRTALADRAEDPMATTDPAWTKMQAEFPVLRPSIVVRISAGNANLARLAAADYARLARASAAFAAVYAPGTGAFYDTFGILYLKPDAVEKIVSRIERVMPLYAALGGVPSLAHVAEVSGEAVKAVNAGQTPLGLADFYAETSRTVIAVAEGTGKNLDWASLLQATPPPGTAAWQISLIPKPGDSNTGVESLARAQAIAQRVRADFSEALTIDTAEEGARVAAPAVEGSGAWMKIAAVYGAGLILMGLLSGSLRAAITILVCQMVAVPVMGAALALFGVHTPQWIFMDLLLAPLLSGAAAAPIVLRIDETMRSGTTLREALARAGSQAGPVALSVGLCAVILMVPLVTGASEPVRAMAWATGAGLGAVVTGVFFLSPALLVLLPGARLETFCTAIDWFFARAPSAMEVMVRWLASAALLGGALFGVVVLAQASRTDVSVRTGDALQALVQPADAPAIVARLEALADVERVRRIAAYRPRQEDKNRAILARLSGLATPPPQATVPADEDRMTALAAWRATLQAIIAAPGTSQRLRGAASDLMQAFPALRSPVLDNGASLTALEQAMFSGVPGLYQRLTELATLPPLTPQTLDPDMVSQYVGKDGRWRLEIAARPGADLARFVAGVRSIVPEATGPALLDLAAHEAEQNAVKKWIIPAFMLVLVGMMALSGGLDAAVLVFLAGLIAALATVAVLHVCKLDLSRPLLAGMAVATVFATPVILARGRLGQPARRLRRPMLSSGPRAALMMLLAGAVFAGGMAINPHGVQGGAGQGLAIGIALGLTFVSISLLMPKLEVVLFRRGRGARIASTGRRINQAH